MKGARLNGKRERIPDRGFAAPVASASMLQSRPHSIRNGDGKTVRREENPGGVLYRLALGLQPGEASYTTQNPCPNRIASAASPIAAAARSTSRGHPENRGRVSSS